MVWCVLTKVLLIKQACLNLAEEPVCSELNNKISLFIEILHTKKCFAQNGLIRLFCLTHSFPSYLPHFHFLFKQRTLKRKSETHSGKAKGLSFPIAGHQTQNGCLNSTVVRIFLSPSDRS